MIHGAYGARKPDASCMKDGQCIRNYSKPFNLETQFGEDGYPQYACPNDGQTFTDSRNRVYDNTTNVTNLVYPEALANLF